MKGCLLDANVLIALAWPNHPHHATAQAWFARKQKHGWGTCAITQLAFIRVSSNPAFPHHVSPLAAFALLGEIVKLPHHRYWTEPPEGFSDSAFAKTMSNVLTHHFVTDGYLATLASINGGKLATFDRQLSRAFPSTELIEAGD